MASAETGYYLGIVKITSQQQSWKMVSRLFRVDKVSPAAGRLADLSV